MNPANLGLRMWSIDLLPLDGARGFAGDVVADAIDAIDFVDDAAGNGLEQSRG